MSHTRISVVAGVLGLAAAVALYLGLVHAVPLVDWGTDETDLLRSEGAREVRIASLFAVMAGVLLLVGRAWWTGGTAVAAVGLLAVLAPENTIASWGLLLLYVLALMAGCGAVAGRGAGRRNPAPPSRAPSRLE